MYLPIQDTYNLGEVNEVKRQVNKLKKYYMQISKAICEIKKLSHNEDKFCERDVHYKVMDNEVKTF